MRLCKTLVRGKIEVVYLTMHGLR